MACSLLLTFSAGPAAAQAAPEPQRAERQTIMCRNGGVDPATCRRFDAGLSNEPHSRRCARRDGLVHVRTSRSHPNGREWVRRADACGTWYDRRWADPRFVRRDHVTWGERTFGPVLYCQRRIGRHCG
jgi:hypothetical protein